MMTTTDTNTLQDTITFTRLKPVTGESDALTPLAIDPNDTYALTRLCFYINQMGRLHDAGTVVDPSPAILFDRAMLMRDDKLRPAAEMVTPLAGVCVDLRKMGLSSVTCSTASGQLKTHDVEKDGDTVWIIHQTKGITPRDGMRRVGFTLMADDAEFERRFPDKWRMKMLMKSEVGSGGMPFDVATLFRDGGLHIATLWYVHGLNERAYRDMQATKQAEFNRLLAGLSPESQAAVLAVGATTPAPVRPNEDSEDTDAWVVHPRLAGRFGVLKAA
jgi:hypothetical protein